MQSIVMSMSVCSFVCLFVYLSIRINWKVCGQTSTIFCACCLWSWLGPSLMTMRYVMYFRFYGWRHVLVPWDQWAESSTTLSLVEFVRTQHRQQSLLSIYLCCYPYCLRCLLLSITNHQEVTNHNKIESVDCGTMVKYVANVTDLAVV